MNQKIYRLVFFIVLCGICMHVQSQDLLQYVQTLTGTAPSTTVSALLHSTEGSELNANTIPTIGVPFGHTQYTPQTRSGEQKCIAPYYYKDKKINGFRASHWINGSCTQDYGSVSFFLQKDSLITDPVKRAIAFDHALEKTAPNYYSLSLPDYSVEITALSHAGILKFTCTKEGDYYLLVEPNSDEEQASLQIRNDGKTITGDNPVHRIYQGWGEYAGFKGHFAVELNKAVAGSGYWKKDSIWKNVDASPGVHSGGAYVKLTLKKGEVLLVKAGMSFTNQQHAVENLTAEIPGWDFESTQEKAGNEWNKALSTITAQGKSEEDKIRFYTALYHSQLLPREVSDVDGRHPVFAGKDSFAVAKGFRYYDDFSMWDTYRAVHPLFNLIAPDRNRDMINSLIGKAEQGGWLPIFPCWNNYTAAMIGDHCIATISDAIMKGVDGIDIAKAYSFMRKNAFQINEDRKSYTDGKGRRALDSYLSLGFIPVEDSVKESFHKNEQVSRTLEYAYDDYALAQVAKKTGNTKDYEALIKRSENYRNVFDTSLGYARAKHSDGSWVKEFDAFKRASWITEGTPFHYSFSVPQNVPGLIQLMGGKKAFTEKLDLFFNKNYYWHGNEHGQHIPYLYVYAGEAAKTQDLLRKIVREEYSTGPGGICGNEDAGQMSAWLVFTMMGFYPVCPGTTSYAIGFPMFEKMAIRCANGKSFAIKTVNYGNGDKYIDKVYLNGKLLKELFIEHQDIINGGELVFYMTDKASATK